MPCRGARQLIHGEDGTASVELVAVVPFLLLAVLVAAQLDLAGQAIWSAGVAARAGARAALIDADPEAAARRALPEAMRPGAEVEGEGTVTVRVRSPRLLRSLPAFAVTAKASLEADD